MKWEKFGLLIDFPNDISSTLFHYILAKNLNKTAIYDAKTLAHYP